MKVLSIYCDTCGIKIHEADFKRDLALKFEDKCYCKDCKEEVIKLIEYSRKKEEAEKKKKKKKKKAKKKSKEGEIRSKDSATKTEKKKKKTKREDSLDQKHSLVKNRPKSSSFKKKDLHPQKRKNSSKDSTLAKKADKISMSTLIGVGGGLLFFMMIAVYLLMFSEKPRKKAKKHTKKNGKKLVHLEKEWIQKVRKYVLSNPKKTKIIQEKWKTLKLVIRDSKLRKEVDVAYSNFCTKRNQQQLVLCRQYIGNSRYKKALFIYYKSAKFFPISSQEKIKLQQQIFKLEERLFQIKADKLAPKLMEKASQFFEEGETKKAMGTLMAFDTQAYAGSSWVEKINDLIQEQRDQEGERTAKKLSNKEKEDRLTQILKEIRQAMVKGLLAQALQLIQNFSAQYPSEGKAKLDKIRAEIRKKQNEEFEKTLAKGEWQTVLGAHQKNLLNWTFANSQTGVSIRNGVLKMEGGSKVVLRATGLINWQDYMIEHELRAIKGAPLLLVRFYKKKNRQTGKMDVRYTMIPIQIQSSGWKKIQWLIRGSNYLMRFSKGNSWGSWKTVKPSESNNPPSGAVGFVATKGVTFEIRNMKVKVFKKANRF